MVPGPGPRWHSRRRYGVCGQRDPLGYRYLTVVIDPDSGRLVWAERGPDPNTAEAFLDAPKSADRTPRPLNAGGARWKKTENFTDRQSAKLADIEKTNEHLYRAPCSRGVAPLLPLPASVKLQS